MCTLVQHCASNFLVQCCLRRIWATLTRQYCYPMLSQHGRYDIEQVIFLIRVVPQSWTNTAQVISLYNVGPYISSQNCRLFFCAKMFVDCGSSLIIASVILMCNVGSDRSRQNSIAYFPTKTCLCAIGQHCTSNFSINFSISNCTSQH